MPISLIPTSSHARRLPVAIRKRLTHLGSTGIAIGILLTSSSALASPQQQIIAQSTGEATANGNASTNVVYIPPPDAGTPQPTGGTGSRGGCRYDRDRPALASLVGQPHLTLTTRDRPTIWIYVPYSATEAPTGTLSLQQGDEELYRGAFSLASSELAPLGVIGVSLPETAPALVTGQSYDWFVDVHCTAAIEDGAAADTDPAVLAGRVERVNISNELATELATAQSGLEAAAAYGNHHIWYDLLTDLARLRLETGQNLELDTAWRDLLSDSDSVGLEPWATEAIVGEVIAGERPAQDSAIE